MSSSSSKTEVYFQRPLLFKGVCIARINVMFVLYLHSILYLFYLLWQLILPTIKGMIFKVIFISVLLRYFLNIS